MGWPRRIAVTAAGVGLTVGAYNMVTDGESEPAGPTFGEPVVAPVDEVDSVAARTDGVTTPRGDIFPCDQWFDSGVEVDPGVAIVMVDYLELNPNAAPQDPGSNAYERSFVADAIGGEGQDRVGLPIGRLVCYTSVDQAGNVRVNFTHAGLQTLNSLQGRSDFPENIGDV